jgi:hypothetical protein
VSVYPSSSGLEFVAARERATPLSPRRRAGRPAYLDRPDLSLLSEPRPETNRVFLAVELDPR